MKYYEIQDNTGEESCISFTDRSKAEEYLNREKKHFPERCKEYGLHIVETERITLRERCEKAFKIANNAIYLNDRSDYLSALYEVCKVLNLDNEDIGKKFLDEK